MLAPFNSAPLPTFENFVFEKRSKDAPSDLEAIKAALYKANLDGEAARLNSESYHPDGEKQAAQHLYDWACKTTAESLGRELNEAEVAYLREECDKELA